MKPLHLGNARELFWDDYLINTSRTSAVRKQHPPRMEEVSLELSMPWEGDGCDYFCTVKEDDIYRMYYLAWQMSDPDLTEHTQDAIKVCCIESRDGIHWERPDLGIVSFQGSTHNNILLDENDAKFDNFVVFLDTNPDCPPEERFKATARAEFKDNPDKTPTLYCYTSEDGYHFKLGWKMTDKGLFDSMNIAFWSPEKNQYLCYLRGFHDIPGNDWNAGIRDIRFMTSSDFKTWSDPVMVDFGDKEDIPLYTNTVFRYPRAPQMMVGIPVRYMERRGWNDNFEQMTGAELRKKRMRIHPRYGLTVTDCVLMLSRDGLHWDRQDEAWLTPGVERDFNWIYGDCYATPGFIQTPSRLPGAPDELSFYCDEWHWSQKPAHLQRYSIRQDGLFSYRADYAPKTLVTKPIFYEGGELSLNFSTSVRGSVYVTMTDGLKELHSCELFGDTLDRRVRFDGEPTEFLGKEIVLEFTMRDADLYSMQFSNNQK